jgi:hypothetical protein
MEEGILGKPVIYFPYFSLSTLAEMGQIKNYRIK